MGEQITKRPILRDSNRAIDFYNFGGLRDDGMKILLNANWDREDCVFKKPVRVAIRGQVRMA